MTYSNFAPRKRSKIDPAKPFRTLGNSNPPLAIAPRGFLAFGYFSWNWKRGETGALLGDLGALLTHLGGIPGVLSPFWAKRKLL